MLWAPTVVVAALILVARTGSSLPGDVPGLKLAQSLHNPVTTPVMELLDIAGQTAFLFALGAIVAAALFLRRRQECYVLVGAVGLMAFGPLLKLLADRPRPPTELIGLAEQISGNGFPSGHTYTSVLFFGALFYLATVLIPAKWLRRFAQTSLVLVIVAMGASRVYLGVHWPSDVIAAYLIGGVLLLTIIRLHRSGPALQRE